METEIVNGLYGSSFNIHRSCAYCKYHKAHLTPKMLKQHECLKKQCNSLDKIETHDYWRQRDQKKNLRKKRKAALYDI